MNNTTHVVSDAIQRARDAIQYAFERNNIEYASIHYNGGDIEIYIDRREKIPRENENVKNAYDVVKYIARAFALNWGCDNYCEQEIFAIFE